MKSIKRISIIIFVFYFMVIFFYGLLIKLFYNTSLIYYLKFVPELILILYLLIVGLLFKNKIERKDLLFMGLLLLLFMGSLFDNTLSSNSFFLAVRDVFIPIVSLIWLKTIKLPEEYKRTIIRCLIILSLCFLAISFPFGALQRSRGWEYTSSFYTGQSFYGRDLKTGSIMINLSDGFVRALGVVGSSAKYAFYSLFSFIFINAFVSRKELFIFAITSLLTFSNIYFSTNKTALVIFFILGLAIIIKKFIKLRFKKQEYFLTIIFAIFGIGLFILLNLNQFHSMAERFEVWGNGISTSLTINHFNIFFGTHLYYYFSDYDSVVSTFDNSYFFSVFSFGILFTAFMIYYFVIIFDFKKNISVYISLFFILAAFTTNVFSGRSFFNLFCLIGGLLCKKDFYYKKMEQRIIER